MPRKPKKKPGEKRRKYTMSDKARAQRRVASRTHGFTCATVARQVLPACIRRQCPLADVDGTGYPCALKRQVEEAGGVVESCPLPLLTEEEAASKFREAFSTGNLDGVKDIAAQILGSVSATTLKEARKVAIEGFSIDQPILGSPDEHGNQTILATIQRENPRAKLLFVAMEKTGMTGADQQLTPKSQGEADNSRRVADFWSGLERFVVERPAATTEKAATS